MAVPVSRTKKLVENATDCTDDTSDGKITGYMISASRSRKLVFAELWFFLFQCTFPHDSYKS